MKMKMKSVMVVIIMFYSVACFSQPNGTCFNSPPMTVVITNLRDFYPFKSFKKGDVGSYFIDGSPKKYSALCNNFHSNGSGVKYIRALTNLPPSEMNPGYYKLSDLLDIFVNAMYVDPDFNTPKGATVPFLEKKTGELSGYIRLGNEVVTEGFSTGTTGSVTFKLRKDVLDGVIVIPAMTVASFYYRFYTAQAPGDYASLPYANLMLAGDTIPVPAACTINDNAPINVELGNMQIDKVSQNYFSQMYKKNVGLFLKCSAPYNQKVDITLKGSVSSFDAALLTSSNKDVGFSVTHDGQLVRPNSSFDTVLNNGQANTAIAITPVKNSKVINISAGEVSASATLTLSLP